MKKILIFSLNYYPRFIGGAEVAIKEITDRIDTADIEFHMVTLRFDSALPAVVRIGNVLVHRIGPAVPNPTIADLKKFPLHVAKHLYQFLAVMVALRLHHQHRYDGIWAMMAHATGIPAGIFKTFHPKVPYLLTLQEGDPPEHIERLARPVWPLFVHGFTKADALQAISTFLLAWGRRRGFTGKGVVIPNGVDTTRFARIIDPSERERARAACDASESDVLLLTTSRLVHKNAIDDCIRALALMPQNVRFAVLGTGPDEEKLTAFTKELGLSDRVKFLGYVPHEELPAYLAAADIFIRPSRSEGMGNSFIEAMAADVPVIATQEGGIADFLFDKERNPDKETTGWAVDANAPEQIAAAVEKITAHPGEAALVRSTAKRMALESYSWDLVARNMYLLFVELLQ